MKHQSPIAGLHMRIGFVPRADGFVPIRNPYR
jgi:hypothetical protein